MQSVPVSVDLDTFGAVGMDMRDGDGGDSDGVAIHGHDDHGLGHDSLLGSLHELGVC